MNNNQLYYPKSVTSKYTEKNKLDNFKIKKLLKLLIE